MEDFSYCRPALKRFSCEIEAQLQKHDKKKGESGWSDAHHAWLMVKLMEEVGELAAILFDGKPHSQKAIDECLDIGAVAMMIYDVLDKHPARRKKES